jgi:alkylated DNA repair protein alkB family protein 4
VFQPPPIPRPPCRQPIPGLLIFDEFLTAEEEAQLITLFESDTSQAWAEQNYTFSLSKAYGLHCVLGSDYRDRETLHRGSSSFWKDAVPPIPVPPELLEMLMPKLHKLHQPVLDGIELNEGNALKYIRDKPAVEVTVNHAGDTEMLVHHLRPHTDDRSRYRNALVNLSLIGQCTMTYERVQVSKTKGLSSGGGSVGDVVEVTLPPRSLMIQSGDSRYNFTHGISNKHLPKKRMSVTLRQVLNVSTKSKPIP